MSARLASRIIQFAMVASVSIAFANHVGKQAAGRIETIYIDLARQIGSVRAGLRRSRSGSGK